MSTAAANPAAVSCDAGRAGAHHGHAQRVVDAIHAIDPTVHARVGDLGWTVRVSRQPLERFALGEVTVRVPTPWDVRDGACYARATEWSIHRSQPWFSPARYVASVPDAAERAVSMLGGAA